MAFDNIGVLYVQSNIDAKLVLGVSVLNFKLVAQDVRHLSFKYLSLPVIGSFELSSPLRKRLSHRGRCYSLVTVTHEE